VFCKSFLKKVFLTKSQDLHVLIEVISPSLSLTNWYQMLQKLNPEPFILGDTHCFSWMNNWDFLYTSLLGSSRVLYTMVWK